MNNEQPIEYRNEMNASTCNEVESEILEVIDVKSEIVEDESLLHDVSSYNSKLDISMYLRKKGKTKKERKKKHKKKHKKKSKDDYGINTFSVDYQTAFEHAFATRKGHNIPSYLIFQPHHESAFFFGRTLDGEFVGKPFNSDGHIAVFGGSGSGKTTGIAIPNTRTWLGTIFSFDFKGDLIERSKRGRILYLLRGHKNQYWYNPFYLLEQEGEDDLIQNARELAHAIIPLPNNSNDPFWIEAARSILTGAIVYYFRLGVGFIEAMIEIKTTKMNQLISKIETDKMAAVCVNPDLENNPKTLAGISMELHNHISVFATDTLIQNVFSPPKDESKDVIRWEDLAHGYDIIIRVDQSRINQWISVTRLMLVQLIRTLERRPEKYELAGRTIIPTLLMLDEFPQYGRIDTITSALKILRSKNVTVSIFCQSLADLDETYGKATRCTILDNCPYKAILNAADAETQYYFSSLVGTTKAPSKGITATTDTLGHPSGYSFTISESYEPIIFPHEFASLSDIILLHPGPGGFCRIKKERPFNRDYYLESNEKRRMLCLRNLKNESQRAKSTLQNLSVCEEKSCGKSGNSKRKKINDEIIS